MPTKVSFRMAVLFSTPLSNELKNQVICTENRLPRVGGEGSGWLKGAIEWNLKW